LSVCLSVRLSILQYICCLSVSMFFRLFHSIIKCICLAACKLVCPSVGHSSKYNHSIIVNQFKLVFVNNIIISQNMFCQIRRRSWKLRMFRLFLLEDFGFINQSLVTTSLRHYLLLSSICQTVNDFFRIEKWFSIQPTCISAIRK
jgi:hypothetical protein